MPPKKGKKMDLNAFLADESTGGGSWADEMDALPTGPSGNPDGGGLGGSHLSRNQGDRGGFGDRGGSRMGGDYDSDRPPRAEIPIPSVPPYTAFVGNLSFEVGQADLADFFAGLDTTSIRLVEGHDGKPKGFGYVEFSTVDFLKDALALSGTNMGGRTVRISVAEAPKNREGRADEDMTWTRQGPLAPLAGSGRSGGGFDRPRTEGFGSSTGAGGEDVVRDGPIRGGKFVPSAPSEQRRSGGFDRNVSGGSAAGREGPREFAPAPLADVERDGPIRGGKFVPSAAPPERQFGGERRGPSGPGGPADEEKTWSRQGPLAPIAGARASSFGAPRTGGTFGDHTPPQAEQPQQRQRLQLAARSATPSTEVSPTSSPAPTSRPSPFGAAKPVNNAEREREVEAKLARDREALQAKLAAEKEKRDASGFGAARKASSPFGSARPVDVSEKQSEVEEKIAKARAEAAAAKASTPAAEPVAASEAAPKSPEVPPKALRKEGFSYSSVAVPKDQAVEEVTQQVAETTVA